MLIVVPSYKGKGNLNKTVNYILIHALSAYAVAMPKMSSLSMPVLVSVALHVGLLLGLTLLLDSYQSVSIAPMTVSLIPRVVVTEGDTQTAAKGLIAAQTASSSREVSQTKPTLPSSQALPSSIPSAMPAQPAALPQAVPLAPPAAQSLAPVAPIAAVVEAQSVPTAPQTATTIPSSATTVATAISFANNPSSTPVTQEVTTELPISNAAYLNNPPPQYPSQSRRLGERGTVKWRVLIGTDGRASDPELVQSSGFSRLDDAAKQAVLAWRYVPGKRGGVVHAMRYVVPLSFE